MMNRHAESRDTALINARRLIAQLASSLRLQALFVDRAYRLFQLALQKNVVFGRRQSHIVASCLYIICRQEKSPFLLIDFADLLQVNVFVLGRAFLHFSALLRLQLPLLDPSLYIHRFASQFDFREQQGAVVTAALRLVTRLKKDWVAAGRRPDSVCAAALLLAARSLGFSLQLEGVAALFRIAADTLKRRLLEVAQT
ncbi:transcription initiation factor IIB family protein, partial [archaeon]